MENSELFTEDIVGLEPIHSLCPRLPIPAVRFVRRDSNKSLVCSINRFAGPFLGEAMRVGIRVNSTYIVFLPSTCYRDPQVLRAGGTHITLSVQCLANFGLDGKYFKAYKYKNGFLIKRNEPIQEGME